MEEPGQKIWTPSQAPDKQLVLTEDEAMALEMVLVPWPPNHDDYFESAPKLCLKLAYITLHGNPWTFSVSPYEAWYLRQSIPFGMTLARELVGATIRQKIDTLLVEWDMESSGLTGIRPEQEQTLQPSGPSMEEPLKRCHWGDSPLSAIPDGFFRKEDSYAREITYEDPAPNTCKDTPEESGN